MGDIVRIIECRPLSKLKRWRLGEVVRKAVQVAVQPDDVDLESHRQSNHGGIESRSAPKTSQEEAS